MKTLKMFPDKTIHSLLFLIVFSSCSSAKLKEVYNVTDPTPQTAMSVQTFLRENGFENKNLIFFKDLKSLAFAQELKYFSMPTSLFYNREGQFIDFAACGVDDAEMQAQFSENVSDLSQFKIKSKYNIDEILALVDGQNVPDTSLAETTVILTFGTWFGKLNEDSFTRLKLLEAEKANGADIQIFLLSCDVIENWRKDDSKITK
jgi:hypothetical protein